MVVKWPTYNVVTDFLKQRYFKGYSRAGYDGYFNLNVHTEIQTLNELYPELLIFYVYYQIYLLEKFGCWK